MSFTSAIFTLKPIIDILHQDASKYEEMITQLKDKIKTLEQENALLREVNTKQIKIEPVDMPPPLEEPKKRGKPKVASKPQIVQVDDTQYAKEAESFEEPKNVVVENSTPSTQSTEKVVTVNVGEEKTRKEYQREYQRTYRKLQKEKQQQ